MIICMYCEEEFPDIALISQAKEHIYACEDKYIEEMQKELNLGTDSYGVDDNSPAHTNNFDRE